MTDPRTDQAPEPTLPDGVTTCPWCAEPAAPGATQCRACGAALAQHDSLGGVRIAGLTAVDPALEDFDQRPLRIPGPSPPHGYAPTLAAGVLAGGPVGLMAFGGIAAIAGAEFLAATGDGIDAEELAAVGRPSAVALQAIEQLEDEARDAATTSGTTPPAGEPDA